MGSRSLVDRLLAVSLFAASCFGTLALFGSVSMLPHLTARMEEMLPDGSEVASNDSPPRVQNPPRRLWVAQFSNEAPPRSVNLLRYHLPR